MNADGAGQSNSVGQPAKKTPSEADIALAAENYLALAEDLRALARRSDSIRERMLQGSKAWEDGDDPCAMADCDPSDQYVLGEELEGIVADIEEKMPAFAAAAFAKLASCGEFDDAGEVAREAASLAVGEAAEVFERMSWESDPDAVKAMACEELGLGDKAAELRGAAARREAERSEKTKSGLGARVRKK
jgi:hypothetical protein